MVTSPTVALIVRRVEGGGSAVCHRRRRRVIPVDAAALGAVGGENVVGPECADVVQGPLDERVPP